MKKLILETKNAPATTLRKSGLAGQSLAPKESVRMKLILSGRSAAW